MTRRIVLCSFAVATLVALTMSRVAFAQVDWTWEGMVVPPGKPGDWDSYSHRLGDVVFDGTTYHMYLLGGQTFLPWDSPWAVGHWTWNALTQDWDEDIAHNPVLSPEPGQWDGYTIYSIAVLYHEGVFEMRYGAAAAYPGESRAGYAESLDGSVWTKYPGNPLPGLEPGLPGEWDDAGMDPTTVLFDGAGYRIWYFAIKADGGWGTWRLGTATSTDGITWTKHPDPVLVGSLPWEGNLLYYPEVIPYGGGYAMWYTGSSGGTAAIGYAVSPDGIHWGRWPGNPVVSPLPGCNAVDSIAVIVEGDTVHGWVSNCRDVWNLISQLEVVFFDAFETGDISIWSTVVP
jgi:hypothetical protein